MLKLLKLDMTGNSIGKTGASLLAKAFTDGCRLCHLSLAGNKLGDNVLSRVLEGMRDGGASRTLAKLDLRDNNLVLTSSFLAGLSGFPDLLVLDLSYNSINLETKLPRKPFLDTLGTLRNLQVFSLHDPGVLLPRNCHNVTRIFTPGMNWVYFYPGTVTT